MIVRKFKKEDLAQVLELCREVRQHHIDILNGYFTQQDDQFEQLGFLQSLEDDKMCALVAANDDIVCGYLLAERKYSPYLEGANVVHIANFGVQKDLRGKGIGKELMNALFEICKQWNVDEIRLGVFNKNVDAYHFYEQYGFEPFEQRMNLQMKKKL